MIKKALTFGLVGALLGAAPAPAADPVAADPTHDVSVVSVSSDVMTVVQGKESETMEVLQLLRVKNSSDRTFAGSAGAAQPVAIVRLPFPQGAFDLLPTDDLNRQGITMTREGIATTAALPPGETTVSFVYRVRAPRTGWQLRREVFYPTSKIDLLIGPSLALKAGPGFTFAETKQLGGKTYRRYRGENFQPGAVLGADIGYDDAPGAGLWFGLGAIAAVLTAVVVVAAMIRRREASGPFSAVFNGFRPRKRPEAGAVARGKASMVEQIARLDLEHEAGAISDEDYLDRREDMKSKLT